MNKTWCVYVHTSPSNKRYVGITSQKPNNRWRNGNGYAHNEYFSNAINKYGWDNFKHEIVADELTEFDAKSLEVQLIAAFKSNCSEFGYNISAGGDGATGVPHHGELNPFYGKRHTAESRKKMSESRKGKTGEKNSFYGKRHTEETKNAIGIANGEPVCQFDTEFNLIMEYRSAKYAAKKTGLFQSAILGCCNKSVGYVTAGGFAWMYKRDVSYENIEDYRKRLHHDKLPKAVCKFTKNMEYLETYLSIADAAKVNNISSSDISNAIHGVYFTCGGFIWVALIDYEKMLSGEIPMRGPYKDTRMREICKYSLDGKFIEKYPNKVLAGKSVNVTPQAIGYACNSTLHKCAGYLWRYALDMEVA